MSMLFELYVVCFDCFLCPNCDVVAPCVVADGVFVAPCVVATCVVVS